MKRFLNKLIKLNISKIKNNKDAKILFIVFIVGLFLRLIFINHGFPYIYHSDEPALVRSALGIRFNPNPKHFDWPHLYFYLNYLLYMSFAAFRSFIGLTAIKDVALKIIPIIYNDHLIFYLLSRIFTALLGSLTIITTYLWVKNTINSKAGIFASLALALAPLHVRNSHYALLDVPMLFFLSCSLYFSNFSPILSGLFLGFSISTKYNAFLGGIFPLMLFISSKADFKKRVVNVGLFGLFTVLGFVAGTPFSILDFKTFSISENPKGAFWQTKNLGKVSVYEQVEKFYNSLTNKLPDNLGYTTFSMFILSVFAFAYQTINKKCNASAKILLMSYLSFFAITFYISGLDKNRSHYYMVVYPFFFLSTGWYLQHIINVIKNQKIQRLFLLLVFLLPFFMSVQNVYELKTKKSSSIYGGDLSNIHLLKEEYKIKN